MMDKIKIDMSKDDLMFLQEQNVVLPMNTEQLHRYLPHRYPFLMIDRVVAVQPKQAIVGYKNISHNEEFFNGHFPEKPIMPGVLMVEAMAQLSGVLSFISNKEDLSDGSTYLFAGMEKVRFKHQVIPGDQLYIHSEISAIKRNINKYHCKAYIEDKLACSAEIMLIEQPRESLR